MKVKELIETLGQFSPDMTIVYDMPHCMYGEFNADEMHVVKVETNPYNDGRHGSFEVHKQDSEKPTDMLCLNLKIFKE